MSFKLSGLNSLAYVGVQPSTPPQLLYLPRRPTPNDFINITLGTLWLVKDLEELYQYANLQNGQATWIQLYPQGGGGGGVEQVVTDNGTANQIGGVFQFLAGANTNTISPSTNIFQVNLNDNVNITNNLTVGGTTSLNSSVFLPSYITGALVRSNTGLVLSKPGTDGQVLIASSTTNPAFNTITSTDGTIVFTLGSNSLDMSVPGTGPVGPAFAAYRYGIQTILGSLTGEPNFPSTDTIIFDVKLYDITNNYDATTGIFTAPLTGRYQFSANICWPSTGNVTITPPNFRVDSLFGVTSYLEVIGTNAAKFMGSWIGTGGSSGIPSYPGPAFPINMVSGQVLLVNSTLTVTAQLAAGDTAQMHIVVWLKSDTRGQATGLVQGISSASGGFYCTYFSGYLIN
jgi:hypothetical protein